MLELEYTLVIYRDESVSLEIEKKRCMTNVSFELLISLRCSGTTKVGSCGLNNSGRMWPVKLILETSCIKSMSTIVSSSLFCKMTG